MNEREQLAELAVLFRERKRKVEELTAIDRQIELILFPGPVQKRKSQIRTGREWERLIDSEKVTPTAKKRN